MGLLEEILGDVCRMVREKAEQCKEEEEEGLGGDGEEEPRHVLEAYLRRIRSEKGQIGWLEEPVAPFQCIKDRYLAHDACSYLCYGLKHMLTYVKN